MPSPYMPSPYINQRSLAKRWDISKTILERWRSVGIDSMFLKLKDHVLYRLVDIESYEESCLSTSTKPAVAENVEA